MAALRAKIGLETAREEVLRVAKDLLERLRSHLRVLEVIATLSPLLGLLGTVLGMITAFQALESAGNRVDPAILSGGIWEALLTTAVGLSVAIPTVVALNWFERRIERTAHEIEDAATRVFTADIANPVWDDAADCSRGPFGIRIHSRSCSGCRTWWGTVGCGSSKSKRTRAQRPTG